MWFYTYANEIVSLSIMLCEVLLNHPGQFLGQSFRHQVENAVETRLHDELDLDGHEVQNVEGRSSAIHLQLSLLTSVGCKGVIKWVRMQAYIRQDFLFQAGFKPEQLESQQLSI
jgi:hypothetical protein